MKSLPEKSRLREKMGGTLRLSSELLVLKCNPFAIEDSLSLYSQPGCNGRGGIGNIYSIFLSW
jgi:hypothetical protein